MKTVTLLQLSALLALGVFALPSGPRSIPTEGLSTGVEADSVIVDWRMLASLDYRTGSVGEPLLPYVDREVMIPGFIVPLEDFAEEVSEFLLVPYVGACVHTPAPPPNQLVHVRMKGGEKVPAPLWEPVWVHGTLRVENTQSIYGSSSFFIPGDSVTPYEYF